MKQQEVFSAEVERLMMSKSWQQLTASERSLVLEEMECAAYERYRCLILASRQSHSEAPVPSMAIKENLMQRIRTRQAVTPKKAIWQDWFRWEVPMWQVSLASLAFMLLYLTGIPGDLGGTDANKPGQLFFQGPVDTVFLDTEQAPEDSSDQRQQLLESGFFQLFQPFQDGPGPGPAADRSQLAFGLPEGGQELLPPTEALLPETRLIPLELLEIQG